MQERLEQFLAFLRRVPLTVRVGLLIAGYVLVGVGLERVADLTQQNWQVQPWDPTAGLSLTLLLAFGLSYAPVIFLTPFLNDTLFVSSSSAPLFSTSVISGLSVALGYGVICAVLKHKFGVDPRLRRSRDVVALSAVSLVGTFLIGAVNVGAQLLLGGQVEKPFEMLMHAWAGEATGVALLTPPLLIGLRVFPWSNGTLTLKGEPSFDLPPPSRSQLLKWAAFVGVVAAVTWAAFGGLQSEGLNYTFLVFIPVLWVATRQNLAKTTLIILFINVFAVVFVGNRVNTENTLALQFNLTTLTHVALLLAAIIEGREREMRRRQRAERRLTYDATHDSLTGLYNRAYLMNELRQLLEGEASAEGEAESFALLFCDVDRFKDINDSLGHLSGDRLLVKIADDLRNDLPDAKIARIGGDEFLILLKGVADTARLESFAERVLRAFDQTHHTQEGYTVYTTASIGVARGVSQNPHPYSQPEEVLRDADIALYRAKAGGGNRYVVFDQSMFESLVQRLALEKDLRQAVDALAVSA